MFVRQKMIDKYLGGQMSVDKYLGVKQVSPNAKGGQKRVNK